ncbi:MAG TPA: twin-arginine translocase TatA/TatE family subunit [Candidatus Acidoferrum sp.]|nr:twin-arginine translocase TatA/TatE family subunit [Candidatus Acidoferrum sp.]
MPDLIVLLIVILIVALIWRGPKTLPQIGSILGRGVKAARDEARSIRDETPGAAPKPQDDPPT